MGEGPLCAIIATVTLWPLIPPESWLSCIFWGCLQLLLFSIFPLWESISHCRQSVLTLTDVPAEVLLSFIDFFPDLWERQRSSSSPSCPSSLSAYLVNFPFTIQGSDWISCIATLLADTSLRLGIPPGLHHPSKESIRKECPPNGLGCTLAIALPSACVELCPV